MVYRCRETTLENKNGAERKIMVAVQRGCTTCTFYKSGSWSDHATMWRTRSCNLPQLTLYMIGKQVIPVHVYIRIELFPHQEPDTRWDSVIDPAFSTSLDPYTTLCCRAGSCYFSTKFRIMNAYVLLSVF